MTIPGRICRMRYLNYQWCIFFHKVSVMTALFNKKMGSIHIMCVYKILNIETVLVTGSYRYSEHIC